MGLLDDAIREHLELKRGRGVDPDETAREEREVLGPVRGGELVEGHDDQPALQDSDPPQREVPRPAAPTPAYDRNLAQIGETVELDMRAVLDGEHEAQPAARFVPTEGDSGVPGQATPGAAGGAAVPGRERSATGESLEWEMPGDRGESAAHKQRDEAGVSAGSSDELVEDVLQETPDFLRETPDQDRLWFEQQPPRDFDFDK